MRELSNLGGLYRRSGGVIVGWLVSIKRRGDYVNRYFLAKNFGGMDQALQAAIAFRDEVNQRFLPLTKREKCSVLRRNNTTGVPGIYLTTKGEWKAQVVLDDGRKKRGSSPFTCSAKMRLGAGPYRHVHPSSTPIGLFWAGPTSASDMNQ